MTAVTAALVGQLRQRTDAPMQTCKNALVHTNGDLEEAEQLIRSGHKIPDCRQTAKNLADARDAAAFRHLVKHCSEMKVSFTRDNQVRQLKLVCKATSCTSYSYRDEIRKTLAELGRAGLAHWPEEAPDASTVLRHNCSVCGEPQFATPSGPTCKNGHGGADPA